MFGKNMWLAPFKSHRCTDRTCSVGNDQWLFHIRATWTVRSRQLCWQALDGIITMGSKRNAGHLYKSEFQHQMPSLFSRIIWFCYNNVILFRSGKRWFPIYVEKVTAIAKGFSDKVCLCYVIRWFCIILSIKIVNCLPLHQLTWKRCPWDTQMARGGEGRWFMGRSGWRWQR